jgi:hypothetical protein
VQLEANLRDLLDRIKELWPKLGDGGVRKAAYRGG